MSMPGPDLPAVTGGSTSLVEDKLTAPSRVTPGYTAAAIAALMLLIATSGWWAVAALAALLGLLAGGGVVPVLALGGAGVLIGRGWVALVQSIRGRLRRYDLSASEALPDAVGRLSLPLQRLLRHTRTVRAVIADADLSHAKVLRELYDWLTSLVELDADDAEYLGERKLDAASIRPQVLAMGKVPDAGARAADLLERFEARLLDHDHDPFR